MDWLDRWRHPDTALAGELARRRDNRVAGYHSIRDDIEEHLGIEQRAREGGYRDRPLLELIQNGADAISRAVGEGRIDVVLTDADLYVANTGALFGKEGLKSLLHSNVSDKRDTQIGRFGLGFKSVLSLSDRPRVFSRSISLEFSERRSRERLVEEGLLEADAPVPVLRMAWEVSASDWLTRDPVLSRLGEWADSIVHIPLAAPGGAARIANAMRHFSASFLLFTSSAVVLRLIDDRADGEGERRLHREPLGQGRVQLDVSGEPETWRVFQRTVTPTGVEVVRDAGKMFARPELQLMWAVPETEARLRPGRFWAFFELSEVSRLPGIVNAPWKTSDDRNTMLTGAYNDWLVERFAELIARSIPQLLDPKDPGSVLDFLPRRDGGDDFASALADSVWDKCSEKELVADGTGTLRQCHELKLHPFDDAELGELWLTAAGETGRKELVHPRVRSSRDRRGRWRRLEAGSWEAADPAEARRVDDRRWLEMCDIASPSDSIAALKLLGEAAARIERLPGYLATSRLAALKAASVVLTHDGQLVSGAPSPTRALYLPGDDEPPSGSLLVHPEVAADQAARNVLSEVLKVREFGAEAWAQHLATMLCATTHDWGATWDRLAAVPEGIAVDALTIARQDGARLQVPCYDSMFRLVNDVLRPGAIASAHTAARGANRRCFANSTQVGDVLLKAAGVPERPTQQHRTAWSGPIRDYEWEVERAFEEVRRRGDYSKPQAGYIGVLGNPAISWPVDALVAGEAETRAALTAFIATRASSRPRATVGHSTRQHAYPEVDVPSWEAWLLERYGLWPLGGVYVSLDEVRFVLSKPWSPLATDLHEARHALRWALGDKEEQFDWPEADAAVWEGLADAALADGTDSERSSLYRDMANAGFAPEMLRLGDDVFGLADLYVTTSEDHAEFARSAGVPALHLSETGVQTFVGGGAKGLAEKTTLEFEPMSKPVPFEEAFFELDLKPDWVTGALPAVTFGLIRLQLGDLRTPVRGGVVMKGARLLVDAEALSADRSAVLDAVVRVMREQGQLTLPEGVESLTAGSHLRLRRQVAEAPTIDERLLRAAGGVQTLLEGLLPALSAICIEEQRSDQEIASLFLATHGPESLKALKDVEAFQRLGPPSRWTGTGDSLAFVRALGFPDSFSGQASVSRSPWEEVRGPIKLEPLHDFQDEVADGLRALFAEPDGRRRAIVSLPTGAGKTRVLVDTLVTSFLVSKGSPLVLWVADRDELCEQAVQCFDQVWTNLGNERRTLRVSRLWGGFGVGLEPVEGAPQVVVASIQTLNRRFEAPELQWVARASAIVIDEAHHAITPTYTALLRWLESGDEGAPAPLIGLTATPFRGFDVSETMRLAARFDRRIFPPPDEHKELYGRLQREGVLAHARHSLIEIPDEFELSAEEAEQIDQFSRFPDSAAYRLGQSSSRNDRILQRLLRLPNEQKALVFACSVEHSQLLAGLLNLNGCRAAAISGETQKSLRRSFIADFLEGDLRVLTNYGVLTTGFDAPKVDVIAITRPTYSPALYQQMVGRGLRGPKNGGKESCHLINVYDNQMMYGSKLAFHHFAALWDGPS